MYKIAKPLFLTCQTPTHVGSGSDLGIVDLPIQRERPTSYPKIEASSFKGAIRERFEGIAEDNTEEEIKIHLTFGYDDLNAKSAKKVFKKTEENKDAYDNQFAGALGFTDSRLLLFPVKSLKGVYAMITCPAVLRKLQRELELMQNLAGSENYKSLIDAIDNVLKIDINSNEALVASNELTYPNNSETCLILEEYLLKVTKENISDLANALSEYLPDAQLNTKLVVLKDDDFKDFTNLSTEVITRIKINNEKGTVQDGALFTEEYVPCETIFYNLITAGPIFQSKEIKEKDHFPFKGDKEEELVMQYFYDTLQKAKNTFQIGGSATLGKGIVTTNFQI